jgi:hypothetical protein
MLWNGATLERLETYLTGNLVAWQQVLPFCRANGGGGAVQQSQTDSTPILPVHHLGMHMQNQLLVLELPGGELRQTGSSTFTALLFSKLRPVV